MCQYGQRASKLVEGIEHAHQTFVIDSRTGNEPSERLWSKTLFIKKGSITPPPSNVSWTIPSRNLRNAKRHLLRFWCGCLITIDGLGEESDVEEDFVDEDDEGDC